MGFQDDYVMRTISDLVRAIARLALGKNDIDYELPEDEDKYTPMDRVYRQLKDMADAGAINGAENYLSDQLDPQDSDRLEMALTFYMYLNPVSYTHLNRSVQFIILAGIGTVIVLQVLIISVGLVILWEVRKKR